MGRLVCYVPVWSFLYHVGPRRSGFAVLGHHSVPPAHLYHSTVLFICRVPWPCRPGRRRGDIFFLEKAPVETLLKDVDTSFYFTLFFYCLLVCFLTKTTLGQKLSSGLALPW